MRDAEALVDLIGELTRTQTRKRSYVAKTPAFRSDADRLRAAVAKRQRQRLHNLERAATGAIAMTSRPDKRRIVLPGRARSSRILVPGRDL